MSPAPACVVTTEANAERPTSNTQRRIQIACVTGDDKVRYLRFLVAKESAESPRRPAAAAQQSKQNQRANNGHH